MVPSAGVYVNRKCLQYGSHVALSQHLPSFSFLQNRRSLIHIQRQNSVDYARNWPDARVDTGCFSSRSAVPFSVTVAMRCGRLSCPPESATVPVSSSSSAAAAAAATADNSRRRAVYSSCPAWNVESRRLRVASASWTRPLVIQWFLLSIRQLGECSRVAATSRCLDTPRLNVLSHRIRRRAAPTVRHFAVTCRTVPDSMWKKKTLCLLWVVFTSVDSAKRQQLTVSHNVYSAWRPVNYEAVHCNVTRQRTSHIKCLVRLIKRCLVTVDQHLTNYPHGVLVVLLQCQLMQ